MPTTTTTTTTPTTTTTKKFFIAFVPFEQNTSQLLHHDDNTGISTIQLYSRQVAQL